MKLNERPGLALGLTMLMIAGCGGGESAPSGTSSGKGTPAAASGTSSAPVKAPSGSLEVRKYKLVSGSGSQLSLSQVAPGRWEVADAGTIHVAELRGGDVTLRVGTREVARGTIKGDKLKLSGALSWVVKFRADKTKVELPSGAVLEFKIKPDKIKLVVSEQELGKVKYYPDNGKVKVKDAAGAEVAVIKGFDHLTAAPGAYLFEKEGHLDAEGRNLMMAMLLAVGK